MLDLLNSAGNLHAALLRREFSAGDVLFSTLAATERLDPALNAIVQKDAASARRGQLGCARRARRGPPLEGLPATIKDCFEVAGIDLRGRFRVASAEARPRRAGAIRSARPIFPLSPANSGLQ